MIDVSLKNWGTPKTIAYAILIALANHPKTNLTCYGFVIGQTFEPIRIDNVHDIIDALWKVDTCLHPAEGLQEFFKEHESFKDKEVCIISSAEVMKDTEMLKVCNENRKLIDYMIHCESSGTIDVYKNLKNSKKHIQQIRLPCLLYTSPSPRD